MKKYLFLAVAVLCSVTAFFLPVLSMDKEKALIIVIFLLPLWGLVFFLHKKTNLFGNVRQGAVLVIILFIGMYLRLYVLPVETADYVHFLSIWAEKFRIHGIDAFKLEFSDYNMPYLYFMYLLSFLPVPSLYSIKLLSVCFDLVLVAASVLLVNHYNPRMKFAAAVAVWVAPTVFLNGAFWGQCDSIYAAFVVLAFYFAVKDRPVLSVVMAALGFAFKLQTIFFLPVYAVFWMYKKVKIRHLFIFPATFFVTCIPAWILGKPLKDILGVYVNQTGTYNMYLNLNSPSVFAVISANADVKFYSKLFVVIAALFVITVFIFAWLNRKKLNDTSMLLFAALFVSGIPWLLPHMHDRYFYLTDVFTIFIALLIARYFIVALLSVFASYSGYHAYLFGHYFLRGELVSASMAMMIVIVLIVLILLNSLDGKYNLHWLKENIETTENY